MSEIVDNDDRLIQALDAVLTRLADGERIETCLASYPDLADELSSLIETRRRLDPPLPVPALSKEALEARHRQFMTAVRVYQSVPVRPGLFQRALAWVSQSANWHMPRGAMRIARVAIVLALAVIGLAGVTQVAQASMPDSPLYPLKLGIEDVRLSLTFDPRAQAQLAMAFVVERTDELERLANSGSQVPAAVEQQLVKELSIVLSSAARVDVQETSPVLMQLSQLAETQRLRLAQLAENSAPANRDALRSAEQALAQVRMQAQAGVDDPAAFHFKPLSPLTSPLPVEPGETPTPSATLIGSPVETATPQPTGTPLPTPTERIPTPRPNPTRRPTSLPPVALEHKPTSKPHETPTPKARPTTAHVPDPLPRPTHVPGTPVSKPTSRADPRPEPTNKPEPAPQATHQPNPEPKATAEHPEPKPKPTREK
jgi:hypothetical protein